MTTGSVEVMRSHLSPFEPLFLGTLECIESKLMFALSPEHVTLDEQRAIEIVSVDR